MPTGDSYGRARSSVNSFKHLSRIGPSESELARYLYPLAHRDVVYYFDDFVGGGAMETGAADWNESILLGAGTNGTKFTLASTQLVNGILLGTTNNVAGDEQTLRSQLVWKGDHRCGMEICVQIDNNTSIQWEVGFTDALSAVTTSAIDDIDTPSIANGATDVALLGQDTGQTLKSIAFITDGSTTGMNTTKTDMGTRNMTNATYMTMRVQLNGDYSFAYLFDSVGGLTETAQHDTLAKSLEGDTLLQFWGYWEPLTTSARNISIDYIGIWQDRVA
jgi:hypothetical protein